MSSLIAASQARGEGLHALVQIRMPDEIEA
jgi:hypothetical protein